VRVPDASEVLQGRHRVRAGVDFTGLREGPGLEKQPAREASHGRVRVRQRRQQLGSVSR